MNIGRCTDCGQSVIWSRSINGKSVPLNPQPVQVAMGDPEETIALRRAYSIHFDTCAKRKEKRS